MRLLLELYCVIVIKHVALLTLLAKLTMAFTFTSLHLNFYTSVSGCGCGFGFEQKYWQIDGFGEKARIGGFTSPYLPPSLTISTDCMNMYTLDKLVNKAIDVVFAVVIVSKHKVFSAFVDNSVYSSSSEGLQILIKSKLCSRSLVHN